MTVAPVGDKMLRVACESFTGKGEDDSRTLTAFLIKCPREDDRNRLCQTIESVLPQSEAAVTPESDGAVVTPESDAAVVTPESDTPSKSEEAKETATADKS
jgi:hypothetical protein